VAVSVFVFLLNVHATPPPFEIVSPRAFEKKFAVSETLNQVPW
jgi:hypothetical protein